MQLLRLTYNYARVVLKAGVRREAKIKENQTQLLEVLIHMSKPKLYIASLPAVGFGLHLELKQTFVLLFQCFYLHLIDVLTFNPKPIKSKQ